MFFADENLVAAERVSRTDLEVAVAEVVANSELNKFKPNEEK